MYVEKFYVPNFREFFNTYSVPTTIEASIIRPTITQFIDLLNAEVKKEEQDGDLLFSSIKSLIFHHLYILEIKMIITINYVGKQIDDKKPIPIEENEEIQKIVTEFFNVRYGSIHKRLMTEYEQEQALEEEDFDTII